MNAAADLVRDPEKLEALCSLWQSEGRCVWITLRGASMAPAIRPGARLLLACSTGAPGIGEIIAYRRGGTLVVHRLIARLPDSHGGEAHLICRGDANTRPDLPIRPGQVVGTICRVCRPSPAARITRRWRRVLGAAMRKTALGLPGS